jgi:hypothetical protein
MHHIILLWSWMGHSALVIVLLGIVYWRLSHLRLSHFVRCDLRITLLVWHLLRLLLLILYSACHFVVVLVIVK